MKEKTCCFTGHRIISAADKNNLIPELNKIISKLIETGYCCFVAGGALGFDTIAAQEVIKLKKPNPNIKLILVLPCKNQTRGWNSDDISVYESIIKQADKVMYTSEHYYNGCMQKRNRYMVDSSSVCVTYCIRSTGGTAYTVRYAEKNNVHVIFL